MELVGRFDDVIVVRFEFTGPGEVRKSNSVKFVDVIFIVCREFRKLERYENRKLKIVRESHTSTYMLIDRSVLIETKQHTTHRVIAQCNTYGSLMYL